MNGEVKNLVPTAPFNLTDVDRKLLSQTDEEYIPHSWEELKEIVAANDLSVFRRVPSQLARYIQWSSKIKAEYGAITNYVCQERLHWVPQPESKIGEAKSTTSPQSAFAVENPVPFADSADYKILRNDWPYGVAPGIAHLVVWMKTPIPVNPEDGGLISESKDLIQSFVDRQFVQRLKREPGVQDVEDRILWFKNWTALQSVGALEHFHVMVRDVSEDLLVEWTGESERTPTL